MESSLISCNLHPRIILHPGYKLLPLSSNTIEKNSTITLYGKGIDQETKDLIYTFILPSGTISGLEKTTEWTAPDAEGSL